MSGSWYTSTTQSSTSVLTSSSQTTTSTITGPQNSLILPNSTVSRYAYNNTWEFSVFGYLDQNNLDLNSTLTYLSPQTEEFEIQSPINTLQVLSQNGTGVWNWAVPGALRILNVTQNEEFTDFNQVPIDIMAAAGNYSVVVLPLLSTNDGIFLGQSLEVNLTVVSFGPWPTETVTENNVTTTTIESPTISYNQNLVLTENQVYAYNDIPAFFVVGNFTIQYLNQYEFYTLGNGTTPFSFQFNVTTPNGNSSTITFLWSPPCSLNLGFQCEPGNSWVLPSPQNAIVNYLDANLLILWYTNTTGFYAAFQEWDEIQLTTSTTTSTSPPASSSILLDSSNGTAACESLMWGQNGTASWHDNVCTLTGSQTTSPTFLIESYSSLEIFPGVTLVLDTPGFGFANYGTIINNGSLDIENSFDSYGIIDNYGEIMANATFVSEIDNNFMSGGGTLNNYGAISIDGYYESSANLTVVNGTTTAMAYLSGGSYDNGGVLNNAGVLNVTGIFWNGETGLNFTSVINNNGTIRFLHGSLFQNYYDVYNSGLVVNSGNFVNNGTVVNFCQGSLVETGGTYSGNPVTGVCGTMSIGVTTITEEENSSS